jgi:hypothetical protein
MSAEQLAAAEKAGDEISPEERAKRKRFHERLGAVRSMNKTLSQVQREARLQRKTSRGRVHKSAFVALKITVLLNMMREMKGLPLVYTTPAVLCRDPRCSTTIHPARERAIHAIQERDLAKAAELRKEINLLFDLDEFIEEHKDFNASGTVTGRWPSGKKS